MVNEEHDQILSQKSVLQKQGRPLLREEIANLDKDLLNLAKSRFLILKNNNSQEGNSRQNWMLAGSKHGFDLSLWEEIFNFLENYSITNNCAQNAAGKNQFKFMPSDIGKLDDLLQRLLVKRQKLLEKLKRNGKISVDDEKFLREKWQHECMQSGNNSSFSTSFFLCLQNLELRLPRTCTGKLKTPNDHFILYSGRFPTKFCLTAPLDDQIARSWFFLACVAGQSTTLWPILENENFLELSRAMQLLGARIELMGARLQVKVAKPIGTPDIILNVGNDDFNFYLVLCHYLGSHSRLKIVGEKSLKIADLHFLRKIMPKMGARIIYLIPKSVSLPARIECSGLLPPVFKASSDLPPAFIAALLLCAGSYKQPFAVDLSDYPERNKIFERIMPILEQSGVTFAINNDVINFDVSPLLVPQVPDVPLDLNLAVFLLAIVEACSGEIELKGIMPQSDNFSISELFVFKELNWKLTEYGISASARKMLTEFIAENLACKNFEDTKWLKPLFACLAAIALLAGGKSSLPKKVLRCAHENGFLAATGIAVDNMGNLYLENKKETSLLWNAPDAYWAVAYAVTALTRRKHRKFQLGNPAIIKELWKPFWQFISLLTRPLNSTRQITITDQKQRRRIRTQQMAVLPELPEEDF